jgi:glycosyltransferase involved in cell wall biosynthesis
VCFLGGTRYLLPLSPTAARKFAVLSEICEAFVIAFGMSARFRRARQVATFYLLPGFQTPLLRYVAMGLVGPSLGLWCVLRHGVSIVVAQSPFEGLMGLMVKMMSRLAGRRVALITESHGDFEASIFMERRLRAARAYRWAIPRVAAVVLRHSDLARAVSTSTSSQLQRFAPQLPVVQFVTWSDSSAFVAARRYRTGGVFPVILFAGVLIPRKGVHVLIEAFPLVARRCSGARLTIAGRHANLDYTAALRRRVSELGVTAQVTFAGELEQAELAQRMADAAVFVLPTYSEGLPRVVLEAMAVGTPVVVTRTSGIPEVVIDGVTGLLVEPGNAEDLAEHVSWVLEHRAEAFVMAARARQRVAEVFSAEAYREGYRRLFHAVSGLTAQA